MTFQEGLGTSSSTQHRNTSKCRKISGTNIKSLPPPGCTLCFVCPSIRSGEGGTLQGSGYKGISNTQPQRIWLETRNQCLSPEAHLSCPRELRGGLALLCHFCLCASMLRPILVPDVWLASLSHPHSTLAIFSRAHCLLSHFCTLFSGKL